MPTDNEVIGFAIPHKMTIGIMSAANSQGSTGRARTVSGSDEPTATFSLQKNTAEFGTVNFAAAATTPTFSVASATSFIPGDALEIVAPTFGSPTTVIAGVAITLRAGVKVHN